MKRTSPTETKLLIAVWHPFALWRPPRQMSERVRQRWPEMRVVHLPTYERLKEELPDAQIFVGYSLRPEQFPWATRLQWIHSTAAGVKQLMYPALQRSGIVVTNASGVHSIPMAEHILGMLIAMARRFPDAFRNQRDARWAQQAIWDSAPHPRELRGQVLLLIGFGAVGQEVARLAQPIGMRIRAVTRSGHGDTRLAERIYPVSEMKQALSEADFIVLAAPETPETFHMMGAPQFQAMKKTAYFINVARGSLVDEGALVEALEKRAIAGAALDVAEEEPLPERSPLWKLENVFITPHLSAASESLWERQTDLLLENLERWFGGRELLNRVDLERGY
ncbi:MAG: D-2-hydroxyacid dehydrogenase [Candidatus Acidiferrales bacterium]